MPDITLSMTDEQYKAVRHFIKDPRQWLENVLKNKVTRCIDRAVTEATDRNPKKITMTEKIQIVKDAVLDERSVR